MDSNHAFSVILQKLNWIPTKWLIPLSAGLYQLSIFQKSTNASFFDFLFDGHCFAASRKFVSPNQVPWTLEPFRSFG